mgnify:CR=1 FL=1
MLPRDNNDKLLNYELTEKEKTKAVEVLEKAELINNIDEDIPF